MADEYIRKTDAVNAVPKERIVEYMDEFGAGYNSCRNDMLRSIESLEPADVVQVVHGRWIDSNLPFGYFANCSACGYQMDVHVERGYFKYCPNCGADMREVDE